MTFQVRTQRGLALVYWRCAGSAGAGGGTTGSGTHQPFGVLSRVRGVHVFRPRGAATGGGGGPTGTGVRQQFRVLSRNRGVFAFSSYGTTTTAPEAAPTRRSRRAGARTKLESDRRRLALQWWYDYLTKPQPSEQTKRVIAEIKAGRPIPQDAKPPKGPDNISAQTLADRILPERRIEAENVLAHMVDMQKVVENALRIAQEREEEELLMLL